MLIKEKQKDREQELYDEMYFYAEKVNVNDFSFPITFYVKDDKQIFTVNDSWENFYALKNIQRTLRGLFDVKQDTLLSRLHRYSERQEQLRISFFRGRLLMY